MRDNFGMGARKLLYRRKKVYITYNHKNDLCNFGIRYQPVNNVVVIPETVGQYTGLTDKNVKKIFEGDIIEYDKDGARYKVVFAIENDISKFCSKCLVDGTLGYINQGRDKVIGNIRDNPELLED